LPFLRRRKPFLCGLVRPGRAFASWFTLLAPLGLFANLDNLPLTGRHRVVSPEISGSGTLALHLEGSFATDVKYVPEIPDLYLTAQQFGISYGLTPYWECGINGKTYADIQGFQHYSKGWGDVNLLTKIVYPPYKHPQIFDLAFVAGISIPAAYGFRGGFTRRIFYPENSPYGSTYLDVTTLLSVIINFEKLLNGAIPLKLFGHIGELFANSPYSSDVHQAGINVDYSPVRWCTIFSQISGETKSSQTLLILHSPLRASGGLVFSVTPHIRLTVAGDYMLSSLDEPHTDTYLNQPRTAKLYPRYEGHVQLTISGKIITPDTDQDGIRDDIDKCPREPEDKDDFEDADGCPDFDNDRDGIPDIKDQCPGESEDKDGYEDADGCPDIDNDLDGIPDAKDRCPNQPEDKDGIDDIDGCPDRDNDQDGLLDSSDRCPNQPEDKDGFEDTDGCPDLDNDKDGIADSVDKCPNQVETFNGYKDDDGCPDKKVPVIEMGRAVLPAVSFNENNEPAFSSFEELNRILESLRAYPEIQLQVLAYTDSYGSTRSNLRKTQQQSDFIVTFLIKNGIEPSRLQSLGMGEKDPVEKNTTAVGRIKNRRIEIVRIK
jgi:hypothetical protein